jgi:phosphoglycolate phosphatase
VPRYDAVLFDLDGTLTDSAPGIINCIHYALDSMGVALPPDDVMRTFLGPPLVDTFGRHFGLSDADVVLAIDRYRERYHDVGLFENDVYPGIASMLDTIGEAGSVLAVSTSKPTYSATRILEHFSLASRFAFIGGAELNGSRQHKGDVIAHTLEELDVLGVGTADAAMIMVGDREHDVLGAATLNLPCIGVLWGYGSAEELTAAGAVQLAEDPAALTVLLTR